MTKDILRRILQDVDGADLIALLGETLSPSELQSLRKFFPGVMCMVLLAVWSVGVSACGGGSEVIREINAAWAPDGKQLLLLESRYRTTNPAEPYFNASSGRDWSVVFYTVAFDAQSTVLSARQEILRWKEDAEPGGSFENSVLYWLPAMQKFVAVLNQQPVLFDLAPGVDDAKRPTALRPPEDVLVRLVGKERASGVMGRSPAPSPDQKWVAVFYTLAYKPEGGTFTELHFLHFVAFFDAKSGAHHKSTALSWPDKGVDPRLVPASPDASQSFYFLWKQDASGVFVMDRKRAFFVPVSGEAPSAAAEVPSHSVQTVGGDVSTGGHFLSFEKKDNASLLKLRFLSDWRHFSALSLIPQGSETYSLNVSD